FLPVVVDGDGAAAKLRAAAHFTVANVREVGDLGIVAQGDASHLHKVSDFHMVSGLGTGADVGKGTHVAALAQLRAEDLGAIDDGARAEGRILHIGVGTQDTAGSHGGLAPEDGAGEDGDAGGDSDGGIDVSVSKVPDLHTG